MASWKEQKEGTWFRKCRVGEAEGQGRLTEGGRSLGFFWGRGSQVCHFRCYCLFLESPRKCLGRVRSLG